MHNLWRYVSVSAAALGAAGLSTVAHTQSTAQRQLEEIIVTAERVETSLQDTPISVTAFSAEDLRRRGAANLLEMSAFTPNLVVGSRPGNAFNRGGFAIRGMGVDAGAEAAVGVYVDEVFYPSGFGTIINMFDVERVEVLRGPQGTLFGRNTIAGAVQYVTAKPTLDDFAATISATAGNNDREDLEGVLNVPIGDIAAARFAFGTQQHGGYVHDNLNNIDRGEQVQNFGRVQVRVQPSDRLTFDIKLEELRQDSNGRGQTFSDFDNSALFVQIAGLSGAPGYTDGVLSQGQYELFGYNRPDFFKSEYQTGQFVVEYDVSDRITFKSITASTTTDTNYSNDFDLSDLDILLFTETTEQDVLNQELRLSGASDRWSWTTGLYYFDSEINGGNGIEIGFAPPGPQQGNPTISVDSKALYGQVSYSLTDRLEGSLGVRYTDEESNTIGQPSATFTDTSPHVGLNFRVTDDVMLYGKASKGFRGGGTSASGGLVRPFGPEEAWTYELGARMEFADRRVRVNPTVFYTEWEDIQFNRIEAGVGTVAVLTQNAGSAEIQGLEIETLFAATDRLQVIASMSYLDGEYDEVDNGVLGQIPAVPFFLGGVLVPELCDGKNDPAVTATDPSLLTPELIAEWTCTGRTEMARSPKIKYALGLRHEAPLSNGGILTTSVDYTFTDDMRSNVTRTSHVNMPSYNLLNARIQYNSPDDRWNVALFGRNLTDEFYVLGGTDFGFTTGTKDVVQPGRPLEAGLSFTANF